MASNKKEEPPRNVPQVKVRQQWTSKCGETCGGQGHGREPRIPPCGSSPPPTTQEDLTCGLRDCYPGDTCRCRCHCMLRQLMRQKLETDINPNTRITRESLVEDVPQLHTTRIHTLEPRGPSPTIIRWPCSHICRAQRRHYYCRKPRYVHAVLENMLGSPPCPCGHQLMFYVKPNGVRDFWCCT